jgi:hypothetical protein
MSTDGTPPLFARLNLWRNILARDNFSKQIIEKLKSRVAHRCSNPNCRVPTSAPSANDKVNNIGIAAHISAASVGGPRYDSSMPAEKRKSIENAIWLCANCSIDIDKDENRYSINVLKAWKKEAEDTARIELGKKLPSNSETIDTLVAALKGFPNNYISTAISNVHEATAKSLENLDSRFIVKTSHNDGKTSIQIYAKEDISFLMKINSYNTNIYREKYKKLFEHGQNFEINSDAITIQGSKLLEEMFNTKGVLSISSHKTEATQKLWLVQKDKNIIESFDDIQGSISFGTKSFIFNGTACNKIFNFSYQKSLNENDDQFNITISLCLNQWEGIDIVLLPYFKKLYILFKNMVDGWELFTALEINGIRVLLGRGIDVSKFDYILDMNNFLDYVRCCQIILDRLNLNMRFTSNISYTFDDYKCVSNVAYNIKYKQVYDKNSFESNAICELIVNDNCENVNTLAKMHLPTTIKIVQSDGDNISIFGKMITLPPKTIILDSVLPKIHGEDGLLKAGDLVKVEWLPQTNFKCEIGYEF